MMQKQVENHLCSVPWAARSCICRRTFHTGGDDYAYNYSGFNYPHHQTTTIAHTRSQSTNQRTAIRNQRDYRKTDRNIHARESTENERYLEALFDESSIQVLWQETVRYYNAYQNKRYIHHGQPDGRRHEPGEWKAVVRSVRGELITGSCPVNNHRWRPSTCRFRDISFWSPVVADWDAEGRESARRNRPSEADSGSQWRISGKEYVWECIRKHI